MNNAFKVKKSLLINASGSTALDIQGNSGQLFSVEDLLTGSLMSVNDISGLPILEVFDDDRVVMGTFGSPGLIVSGSSIKVGNTTSNSHTVTGSFNISGSFTTVGPSIKSGSLRGDIISLSISSNTASMDLSTSNFFTLTLASSATTHLNPTNIQSGQTTNLLITQPATSGSLTYSSAFKFAGGIPYGVSATGSVVDLLSFISFDGTTLHASSLKNLS